DVAALHEVRAEDALDHVRLPVRGGGDGDQAMRQQGVGRLPHLLEGEGDAHLPADLRHPRLRLADALRRAEALPHVVLPRKALWREGGVELEGKPDHLHVEAVLHAADGLLQPALAHVAPRTDAIGDHVHAHTASFAHEGFDAPRAGELRAACTAPDGSPWGSGARSDRITRALRP